MRSIYARLNRRYGRKFIGFDRQKLVSSTLANAMVVTAATPPRDMPRPARAAPRPRVTIVGAGLGGLMAGYTLAHCCDVTIFEARERVGGRVWSKNKASGVVEAGGELIGYNHPLWLALARQFRLGLSLFTLDSNFDALDLDLPIYLDGRKISNPFALKTLFEQMEAAFGRMARRARHVHKHAPWLTSDADALDQQSMADWIRDEHCSRLAKLAMKEQFSNDAGQPVERQSLLANFAVVHGGALKGHPAAFFTQTETSAEAGLDDFLAQATPETKLKLIRDYQTGGRLVAMTGDGTNDAPALAQADVAVAMNTGTQPAREAANMIDLDSNPTKLIEIVEIGKQLLMTRGALTTFSIANDVSKYFAIIPAAFASTYPALQALNVMQLTTPQSAIMSAVIFNALVIIALIPLALRGVPYRPVGAAQLLRDNLLIYGLGGLIAPFIGIKIIDVILAAIHLV